MQHRLLQREHWQRSLPCNQISVTSSARASETAFRSLRRTAIVAVPERKPLLITDRRKRNTADAHAKVRGVDPQESAVHP
jgi:hypothetical protein